MTKSKLNVKKRSCYERLKCKSCCINFENDAMLKIHNFRRHGILLVSFDREKSLTTKVSLRSHNSTSYRKSIEEVKIVAQTSGNEILGQLKANLEYKCDVCEETFKSVPTLKSHYTTIHDRLSYSEQDNYENEENTVKCDICEKSIKKYYVYKHKQEVHLNGRTFSCNVCNQSFVSKNQLASHTRECHSGFIFKCDKCRGKFQTKRALHLHIETHLTKPAQSKCGICGKAFKNLKSHKKRVHTLNISKCQMCDKSYKTKGSLERHHIQKHTNTKQIHKCNYCNKTFSQKGCLKRHKSIVHLEGTLPLKCESCEKRFVSSYFLKQHSVFHNSVGSFQCELCDGRFYLEANLKTHKRIVHEKHELSTCDICLKEFSSLRALNNHKKRSHENVKNYICMICEASFSSSFASNEHRRKVHDEIVHKCNICEKAIKGSATNLRFHIAEMHGKSG